MTISSTTTTVSYNGNGSTTSFPVTFAFFGASTTAEIEVIERVIATGVETTKTVTTHYTVSGGNNSSGTVTAQTAPPNTVQWHIRRITTQTQGTDYVENDSFPAASHENALDRLTMINQEQETDLDLSFKYPDTYTGTGTTVMPEPSAGKGLQWNAGATALENSTEDLDSLGTAAAASAVTASTKADESAASAVLAAAYAVKVDGAASGSDHSSKAWAIGGTGVTDTSSKGAAKEWASNPEDDTVAGAGTFSALHYSAKATVQGTLATNYAVKVNGAVTGSDFSSKAWAIGGTNVTSTASRGAAKEWATTVEDTTVDGTGYSALHHSAKAAARATAALAAKITVSTSSPAGGSDGDIWYKVT